MTRRFSNSLMLFSSIPFLYNFLPIMLGAYFVCPQRFRNAVLLFFSLVFYGWGEPKFVWFMLLSILQGYVFGLLAERWRAAPRLARLPLFASLCLSLGLLGWCKYAAFFARTLAGLTGWAAPALQAVLPIGISFYTFQILSYVIDVTRGTVPAQKNLVDLAAYIAMFPQLIAGPIVRYSDVQTALRTRRSARHDLAAGLGRFVMGLSKKVLLANTLYALVSQFKAAVPRTVLFCWLYAAGYVLHLYFDFSGYSDMAIGLGRVLGFRFPENFDYPYISRSITEFWRRWHKTLGGWFRDYVYIPLGGNRVSRAKWIRNIFIVWALTGLWHGAAWNFVVWGLLFAVLLLAEKFFLGAILQKSRMLAHFYVVCVILASFVLFDADSVSAALGVWAGMTGAAGLPLADALSLYCLRSFAVLLLLGAVGATPAPKRLWQALEKRTPALTAVLAPVGLTVLLLLDTAFLVDGSFNPFLYFRF